MKNRSSHRRGSVKKGVLRNFAKFIGKHLCQSLFFNEVAETLAQVFSCEFCEISKNTFFTKHLWKTASGKILAKKGESECNKARFDLKKLVVVLHHTYLSDILMMMTKKRLINHRNRQLIKDLSFWHIYIKRLFHTKLSQMFLRHFYLY